MFFFLLFAFCLFVVVVVVVGCDIFSSRKANAEITLIILENTTQTNLLPGFQLANQLRVAESMLGADPSE